MASAAEELVIVAVILIAATFFLVVSDVLRSEVDRVNSEIEGYIKLNDHATSAMMSTALEQLSDSISTARG